MTPSYLNNQGKVMIPISFLQERFGATVTVSNRKITLKAKYNTAVLDLQRNEMTIGKQVTVLENSPIVIKKEYFVPINVLEKVFNTNVEYVPELHWLIIYDQSYYVSHLNDFAIVGKALLQGLENGSAEINVYKNKKLSVSEVNQELKEVDKICNAILYKFRDEEPLFLNFYNWSSFIHTDFGGAYGDIIFTYGVKPKYLYSTELAKKMRVSFDSAVNSILKKYIKPSMTDYQKELAIHDYIVKNTKYDVDTYSGIKKDEDSHTAYGVIVKHKAVCDGYALATKILLNKVGIKCDNIYGSAGGGLHAWNQVFIDGQWYQLDTTWDDPTPDVPNKVIYNYFNIPDLEMQQDHYWDKSRYVTCKSDSLNYYTVNKLVVYNQKDLDKRVTTLLKQHKSQINLKTKGFRVNKTKLLKLLSKYTKGYSYYPLKYKSYSKVTFLKFINLKY